MIALALTATALRTEAGAQRLASGAPSAAPGVTYGAAQRVAQGSAPRAARLAHGNTQTARADAYRAPAWLTGATCYEVFVRSFQDSDGDGVGDLRGLTARLDYLNDGKGARGASLGVRCLWIMPIMDAPSYHGYDVRDYDHVNRAYGTDDDFRTLVREAHKRGIRVVVDMVINHASSEWPPFQAALRDTASPYRSWFRFQPTKGPDNRWGNNNWHHSPVRDEWYYGFFWKGMPDLDYTRPGALREMERVATRWLRDFGVDGLRMDAVRYLVEDGAQVDDVPATHDVLRSYAAHARRVKPGAYTVGEVYGENAVLLPYYPGQLDAYFAFESADSLIAAARRGTAGGVLAPMLELQRAVPWPRLAPFLRNHDQPRTMTELGGDAGKARVAATLLLTMPGMPYLYYGEELGMQGPKPDEKIRTPFAWTRTGPHAGFTTGTPWEPMNADSLEANVEAQRADAGSLLALHRTLIHARTTNAALATGTLVPLEASDPAVVAYARVAAGRTVLVVVNLGNRPRSGVTVRGAARIAAPGRYAPRDLLHGARVEALTLDARGTLADGYVPAPMLAAHGALVLDLVPTRR